MKFFNRKLLIFRPTIISVLFLICSFSYLFQNYGKAQGNRSSMPIIKLGAYYFDGWTGKTYHITDKLKNNYKERQPSMGWVTSTPENVKKQIDLASNAGIDFFTFCWYYKQDDPGNLFGDIKNNALKLFLKSPNKSNLEFSLLIANHEGYILKAKDWEKLCLAWCNALSETNYLKVNNKPLITFFSIKSLIFSFKSQKGVKQALDQLRAIAKKNGIQGITIGANLIPSEEGAKLAEACGFDLVTGYNYHGQGFRNQRYLIKSLKGGINRSFGIEAMKIGDKAAWDEIASYSALPQIPVITLNWDTRPGERQSQNSKYFSGFSQNSIKDAIISSRLWFQNNPSKGTKEKLVIAYAWNEYLEGAWLTPSVVLKDSLLKGITMGLKQ